MDRSNVMKLLAVIPERSARRQSGTLFHAREGRAANIARFLDWMSPLNPTSKEDQVALGLTAQPRPDDSESADAADEEEALL